MRRRRQWYPTPVLLPGKSHDRRSLEVCSPWGPKSRTRLPDFTFHFHALEKEMATHSSVLAWRISGMGEPGGLPSMGSHRVGHDWSDLAAAAGNESSVYGAPKCSLPEGPRAGVKQWPSSRYYLSVSFFPPFIRPFLSPSFSLFIFWKNWFSSACLCILFGCTGSSLLGEPFCGRGGRAHSLAAVHRLLIAVASPGAKNRL